jgi:flagellar basal-body rod modification protein FlgD
MAIDAIGVVNNNATTNLSANSIISQEEFLRILLTQLRFQDPMKPMDNEQFVAQLAQFSSLEINREQSAKIDSLLSIQAANQAVGVLGKSVEISAAAASAAGSRSTTGKVTAVTLRTGAPLLTITAADSTVLVDVPLSSVSLIQ